MKLNKLRIQANEKGFTLIELMIVIAIIGILAAVAIPNFIAYRDKAFCSAAESDAKSIAATLADYFAIPTHTSLPKGPLNSGNSYTTGGLKFSPLSGDNTATIKGGVSAIEIVVTDGSTRCPKDYQEAVEGWNGVANGGKFTKNME
ncbi:Prepilin-type N-terminal cleavage/methylation domain-containing protein [Candidatus Electrothrix gigas]